MSKLFISMVALIIGLAFTSVTFAKMEGTKAASPPDKQTAQMSTSEPTHESKAVNAKSASTKKKMKKERKGKKAKKEEVAH